jgi:hypothetical protein
MTGLAYEDPTGDQFYANRYKIQKDANSNRYTTHRDSVVSRSSNGSVLAIQTHGLPTHFEDAGARFHKTTPPVAQGYRPDIPRRSPSRGINGGRVENFGDSLPRYI